MKVDVILSPRALYLQASVHSNSSTAGHSNGLMTIIGIVGIGRKDRGEGLGTAGLLPAVRKPQSPSSSRSTRCSRCGGCASSDRGSDRPRADAHRHCSGPSSSPSGFWGLCSRWALCKGHFALFRTSAGGMASEGAARTVPMATCFQGLGARDPRLCVSWAIKPPSRRSLSDFSPTFFYLSPSADGSPFYYDYCRYYCGLFVRFVSLCRISATWARMQSSTSVCVRYAHRGGRREIAQVLDGVRIRPSENGREKKKGRGERERENLLTRKCERARPNEN